jgi:hypothetical protein
MWTRAESTWPLFDLGEWDELLRITDEVAGWEREHGGVQVGLRALPYKAAVLVHRGRLDEASSLQERFLPPARAIGDPDVLTPALAVSALIAHAAERPAAAIEFIEELEMGTRDHLLDRHLHVTDAMRISAAAGRLDLGQRFLEDAAFAARPRCSLLAARAGAVEGHGELELAAELYAEAASRWEEYGHVLERGYARARGWRRRALSSRRFTPARSQPRLSGGWRKQRFRLTPQWRCARSPRPLALHGPPGVARGRRVHLLRSTGRDRPDRPGINGRVLAVP